MAATVLAQMAASKPAVVPLAKAVMAVANQACHEPNGGTAGTAKQVWGRERGALVAPLRGRRLRRQRHRFHRRSQRRFHRGGGAEFVMAEATVVTPEGRVSPADTGIWKDERVGVWRTVCLHQRSASTPRRTVGALARRL